MGNILIGYNNRAPDATLAGGSWESNLPLNNLKTEELSAVARTTNTTVYNTQLRADFTANYTFRALGFVNHNLTASGRWRARLTTAAMDMDFVRPNSVRPVTLTTSGGANGTRVNVYGAIEAATCPRYDYSPVNLASGAATQTLSSVPAGVYVFICTGSGSVMATGETVANSGAICTSSLVNFVEVTATGDVTLTVTGTVSAIHFRESLGMLAEEARTNSVLYSAAFDNAAWTLLLGASVTGNFSTAPDGTMSADKLTVASGQYIFQSAAGTGTYTFSCYVKVASGTNQFRMAAFNSTDGTQQSAILTATTQWQRFSLTVDVTADSSWYPCSVDLLSGGEFLLWGAQLEAGSFPTTYIPTTSAAVTRTADYPSISGSNFSGIYSATQGTIYVEANAPATAATRGLLSLNDGSGSNVNQLFVTSSDAPRLEVYNGSSQANVTTAAITPGTPFKVASAYAADDFAICTDGGTVGADTAGAVPTVSQLSIGLINGTSNPINGHIRRIAYWPTRLTNAELQAITTTGPEAIGRDTGWMDALQMEFHADQPDNWGEQYSLITAFSEVTARYALVEFEDVTNADGYLQFGHLFAGAGFQPAQNAEYAGFASGREDLSTAEFSVGGQMYGTQRGQRRKVDFTMPVLTPDEIDHWDEVQASVGTLGSILYVPDPDDDAKSQRYGFLGRLRELSPLENPFYGNHSAAYRMEQKL